MNREVSVTKRVKTARGLRYSPVVISANGRIKPDAVYIDGDANAARRNIRPRYLASGGSNAARAA